MIYRLSGDRQEMIKKCSYDRLRSKLVEAGYDRATMSKLDRTGDVCNLEVYRL